MDNITWHNHSVKKEDRVLRYNQKPMLIWFTGLSGSGKSTIANALEARLFKEGKKTYLLDGDNIRHGLNSDLGFSDSDRVENIRRISECARLFVDAGLIVIAAFISPFEKERAYARGLLEEGEFIEVHLCTPIEECERRDPKGLYKKARSGEIRDFTGIDSEYEAPKTPEITLDSALLDIESAVESIIDFMERME